MTKIFGTISRPTAGPLTVTVLPATDRGTEPRRLAKCYERKLDEGAQMH